MNKRGTRSFLFTIILLTCKENQKSFLYKKRPLPAMTLFIFVKYKNIFIEYKNLEAS